MSFNDSPFLYGLKTESYCCRTQKDRPSNISPVQTFLSLWRPYILKNELQTFICDSLLRTYVLIWLESEGQSSWFQEIGRMSLFMSRKGSLTSIYGWAMNQWWSDEIMGWWDNILMEWRLEIADNTWKWKEMTWNSWSCWKWLKLAENGLEWLGMAETRWKWLGIARMGWKCLEME